MPINIPESQQERIVIVGAGFAGLNLAKKLVKKPFQVVLIDQNNYHQFQPLLYQVAMSGLEPSSIAFPLRKAFQKCPNLTIRCTKVIEIKPDQKRIETASGYVNYDHLVLAYGTETNFFNNPNFQKYAYPLKSVSEALYLRNQILSDLEKALITRDYEERQNYLDIVIVGGGPTGVEMAGALAEMKKYIIPKDYPELNPDEIDVYLVQGADRILPAMDTKSSKKAQTILEKMGVIVKTSERVVDIQENCVITKEGQIPCMKVIWAAGVTCELIKGMDKAELGPGKRIIVDEFNRVKNYERIYAIGDLAYMPSEVWADGHPQVAQPAIQQAKNLAHNFTSKKKKPFRYRELGSLATIGRNKAVAELPKFHTTGFIAWIIWLFVHIAQLIGWRNRTVVFINWFWNYLTYDQSLRLIIRPYFRSK
jgi:NADH dehydrogenase